MDSKCLQTIVYNKGLNECEDSAFTRDQLNLDINIERMNARKD